MLEVVMVVLIAVLVSLLVMQRYMYQRTMNALEERFVVDLQRLVQAEQEITRLNEQIAQSQGDELVQRVQKLTRDLETMTGNRDQFARERQQLATMNQDLHRDFGATQHLLFEERKSLLQALERANVRPPVHPQVDRMIKLIGGAS